MRRIGRLAVATFAMLMAAALAPKPALALQHLWFISQIFSDATGTVQFIEFVGLNDNQNQFTNKGPHRIVTGSGSSYTFEKDLPNSATAGAHFLVATQGFREISGDFVPDFIVPNGFLSLAPGGDSLTFLPDRPGKGPTEIQMGIVLPLNGRSISRQRTPSTDTNILGEDAGPLLAPDGTPVPNLARNFAGESFVVLDVDADGIVDARDNCPNALNPDQSDVGGLASPMTPQGNVPDGVGDACQCGDVNDDGRVTSGDATLITRATLQLAPFPSVELLPGFNKCDVVGPARGECSIADATLIQRTTLGLPPGINGALCRAFSGQ